MKSTYNLNKKISQILLKGLGIHCVKWIFTLAIVGSSAVLTAQVRDPFTLRAPSDVPGGIFTLRGDFTMMANKSLTAASYSDNGTNSNADMSFVDIDSDGATFNSSTGQLAYPSRISNPACATIKFAGLYWTGRGDAKVVPTLTSFSFRSGRTYWYTTNSNIVNQVGASNFRMYYNTNNQSLNSPFGWVYMNGTSPYYGSSDPSNPDVLTSYTPSSNTNKYYVSAWNQSGTWSDAEKRQVMIKGPASTSYTTINSLATDSRVPGDESQYSCFADVTTYVQTNGIGNYTVANVKTQEGDGGSIGFFGGWGMIIVYEYPDEPMRNIAIFDGYAFMNSSTGSAALPITGFKAVQSGPVNVKMGLMAGEGDVSISNDLFKIVRKANIDNPDPNADIWDNIPNPRTGSTTNYFNSSVIMDGSRNPSQLNNYGFDAHMFTLNNTGNQYIDNNQTKTAFRYSSTQDQYIIFLIAMAVDAYTPEPIVLVSDNAPVVGANHQVNPGDEITYSFDVKNSGTEGIDSLLIKIPVPYNTTYAGGLSADFSALPSGTCYNSNSVSYSMDTIRVFLKHVPGPNDVGSGTCSVPAFSESTSWAHVTFKLRATDRCAFLQSECARDINTIGYLSGKGSLTGTKFNVTSINGWTSGSCTVAPIYGPNTVKIGNVESCVGDDAVTKDYCAGVTNIPLSQITGDLPPGTYLFYTSNSSWVQVGTTPLTSIPGDGYYLAIPVNNFNPNCTTAIKVRIIIPALMYRDRIYVREGYCSNGESWAKPMGDIQLAMKYARQEVWVAAGTYDSELTSDGYLNPGYVLKDSIKIYGGFRDNPTDAVDNTIYVRNPLDNPTLLVQPDAATVPLVSSPATVNVGTVLNGFYIQNSEIGAASLKDKISLEYCVIRNNSTGINPTVKFNSGGKVVNSLITANTSTGGIMNFNSGGAMHFSTLVDNTGTAVNGTTGTITNSIIWGNTAQVNGSHAISYSGVKDLNNNGIYGISGTNISLDPVNLNTWGPNFGDAPGSSAGMLTGTYSNYWLNFFSRLKGVGDNAQVSTLSLTADLKLAHRIKGAKVDMGAFESRYLRTGAENPIWSGNTVNNMWPTDAQQGNPVATDFVSLDQASHAKMTAPVTLDGLIFCEGKDNLINPTSTAGNNRGIASLFTDSYTLTVNDIYHERRFSPRKWHFLYIPFNVNVADGVLDSTMTPMTFGTTFSVKYYDGINRSDYGSNAYATPGKNWTYINFGNTPNTTTIPKNRGHNFAVLEDRLVYFKANADAANKDFLGNANATLPMLFAPLGTNGAYDGDQGWNLFGVPYSSFFSMNTNVTFPQNWYEMRSKMFNVVFWNSDESGDKYIPVVTTLENKLFPPFSALFTEIIPDPQTSGTYNFTLNNTGRVYQDRTYLYTPANIYHTRSATEEPVLLGLNIMKGNMSDRAVVVLSPDGLNAFEAGRDMAKFGNSNALVPQLSMVVDGKVLGINEIPPTGNSTQVPLRVYIGEAGTYKINLESNPAIAANGYSAVLYDKLLGTSRNIADGDYEFTSDAGTFDSRFVLNMLKVATSVETPTGDLVMYVNNKLLTVTGLNVGDRIEIFDITGQMNFTKVAQTDTETFRMRQKGVYLVKVYQATGTVSKKVIIE